MNNFFHRFAHAASTMVGSPWAFLAALLVLLIWGLSSPLFHYSDTWQLIINTGTTIVTFLIVFLIQNTQNRDAQAIHLKLDELIRALKGARNELVDLEHLTDEELNALADEFKHIRERYRGVGLHHIEAVERELGKRHHGNKHRQK